MTQSSLSTPPVPPVPAVLSVPAALSLGGLLRRYAPLGLAAVAIGVAVLVYRGPGRPFIRGHVGDVAATMVVYAFLGAVIGAVRRGRLTHPLWLAIGAMGIASAIELNQKMWSGTGMAGELFVGSLFDAWDFAAYAAGTVIAIAYDVAMAKKVRGAAGHGAAAAVAG